MGKTVSELECSLSYDELMEWMAYDRLDPIGGFRQDLQTAHLLYSYHVLMGGNKAVGLADFLPVDPNPMTDEQKQLLEQEQHKAYLDACVKRLIAGLGG